MQRNLSPRRAVLLVAVAIVTFQMAFEWPALCWLVLAYLGCLFALRRLKTPRQSFYVGLLVGLGVFVPQTWFLWRIFEVAAFPLWLILALFHGGFLLILNRVEARWSSVWALALAPVLWCGIEYFRCEVWWLRFSWLAAGTCLPPAARGWLMPFGVYGCGALGMGLAAWGCRLLELRVADWPRWTRIALPIALGGIWIGTTWPSWSGLKRDQPHSEVAVAGVQLEFPGVPEVRLALDRLQKAHPEAELLMLSEYTFDGPVPDPVKAWCRRQGKWLVAGGKEPVAEAGEPRPTSPVHAPARPNLLFPSAGAGERFFNTAFVISPDGEVIFTQAKSRPIQFFKDGEPAQKRCVWPSPWGRLGLAICYDASYRRVMDEFVRQGAQALLIPAMDVEAWGEHQHRLDARMARLRAVEYALPVFRVTSSGISQLMDGQGHELAMAPFPGPGDMLAGTLRLVSSDRRLPLDTWAAPACTVATAGVTIVLVLGVVWRRRTGSQP